MTPTTGLLNFCFPRSEPAYYESPRSGRYADLWLCHGLDIAEEPCIGFGEHGPNWHYPPIVRGYPKGGPVLDILWEPTFIIVKQWLADAIAAGGFTGLELHPVELYKTAKCQEVLEGWMELRISGLVELDPVASGLELFYRCRICGTEVWSWWDEQKGANLKGEPEDWPDAFQLAQKKGLKFASTRFADFLIQSGARPLQLTRLADIEIWRRGDELWRDRLASGGLLFNALR